MNLYSTFKKYNFSIIIFYILFVGFYPIKGILTVPIYISLVILSYYISKGISLILKKYNYSKLYNIFTLNNSLLYVISSELLFDIIKLEYTYLFLLIITSILVFIYFLFSFISKYSIKTSKILGYTTMFIVLIIYSFYSSYIHIFNRVDGDAIKAIAQTNFMEGFYYLLSIIVPIIFIKHICIGLIIIFLISRINIKNNYSINYFLLSFSIIMILLYFYKADLRKDNPYIDLKNKFNEKIEEYKKEIERFNKVLKNRKTNSLDGLVEKTKKKGDKHIIIIGESTFKRAMGEIYGGILNSTPLLDKIKDSLLIFKDVISPHSLTVQCLTNILTYADYNKGINFHNPNAYDLMNILKQAGYKTYWISNQGEFSIYDNPATILAKQCDEDKFINSVFGKTGTASLDYKLDEEMLPFLKNYIKNSSSEDNEIYFVHMACSHYKYEQFYNEKIVGNKKISKEYETKIFGKHHSKYTSFYNNAIKYVDYVVNEAIDIAKENNIKSVLYFSDHGENPYVSTGNMGHNPTIHSSFQIKVPMFLWTNKNFNKNRINSNLESPFITTYLTNSLLGLYEIKSKLYNPKEDIFSNKYIPQKRIVFNHDKQFDYDKYSEKQDYVEKTRNLLNELPKDIRNKIYAHRVNTLMKLLETRGIFDGIELDIVYDKDKNEFFVYHPPAKNIGLTLDEYLKVSTYNKNLKYWFDMKISNITNEKDILSMKNKMNSYIDKYNIKDKVTIILNKNIDVMKRNNSTNLKFIRELKSKNIKKSIFLNFPSIYNS